MALHDLALGPGSPLRKITLMVLLTAVAAWSSVGERYDDLRVVWNQPFHPFRTVGNIYYVGVAGISSFLIVTPEGSILLDGALKESAPLIANSISELGFRLRDVKYLLNSHVHYDHAGGLAELKRRSGAQMVASGINAKYLAIGNEDVPAVGVDRVLDDEQTIRLGDTTMTAHITPGHARGCTTWTTTTVENGSRYRVLFYCGTSIVAPLVGNQSYPEIVADYERSFEMLRGMSADVFFEMHPFRFDMDRKLRRVKAGAPNPFVDPTELGRFVDQSEREFRERLAAEQKQKSPT
jgi:metallo-beta-lactamase class B